MLLRATESRVKCQWVNVAACAFAGQRKSEKARDSEMKPKRHAIYFDFCFPHAICARTLAPLCRSVPTPSGRRNEIGIGERILFFSFNLRFGTFTLDYDDGAFALVWESECTAPITIDSHKTLRILWRKKTVDRIWCRRLRSLSEFSVDFFRNHYDRDGNVGCWI